MSNPIITNDRKPISMGRINGMKISVEPTSSFALGDRVTVDSCFYPGRIVAAKGIGRWDVQLDGGSMMFDVEELRLNIHQDQEQAETLNGFPVVTTDKTPDFNAQPKYGGILAIPDDDDDSDVSPAMKEWVDNWLNRAGVELKPLPEDK